MPKNLKTYRPKQRTSVQNRSLHLYFTLVADAFNEAGLTVRKVLEKKMELDWTPLMVKEALWKPAQEALLGKRSTTKLAKVAEIDLIYDHLTRHLGELFELHVPFPSDPNYIPGAVEQTPFLDEI